MGKSQYQSFASKIVDKIGKEITKSPKKTISKTEKFAEKVLEEDELSLVESFRYSTKTRKSPARQEVCQEHQSSSEEVLEQGSEQSSLQQECSTKNGEEVAEQISTQRRRVTKDMHSILTIGLPEFVHPPLLQKRQEVLNGRVGTLFFNYQISEKSTIKTIEQKLNSFKQNCLPLDDDQISWETLKSKGDFTIGEISKLKSMGTIKISASFFALYQKPYKQLYHKMMVDVSKPQKMYCSFAYIDPKAPLRSSFICVSAVNKYIGFVMAEIVDNCPEINKQIEQILSKEKMALLNAIQLLCIFKDKVYGQLNTEGDYELID